MKYLSLFLLLFISSTAHSATGDQVDKRYTIGIGTYSSIVAYDDSRLEDDNFSGGSLSISYAASDIFALRGNFYSLDHDDNSSLESTGFDILGHYGLNMASPGFKAYVGGGIFVEEWDYGSFSEDFDGLQFSGGIGYNWKYIALDLIINLRDSSDYEDIVNASPFIDTKAAAASGSLLLSFRF